MKKDKIVIACKHCHDQGQPVLVAMYTVSDQCYQFFCGRDDHDVDDADPIHFHHLLKNDLSLQKLIELEHEFVAERDSSSDAWKIRPLKDDEIGN